MNDELDRRLAADYLRTKLAEEYATNPIVNAFLTMACRDEMSAEDALVGCIKTLVEQNQKLISEAVDASWRRSAFVTTSKAPPIPGHE